MGLRAKNGRWEYRVTVNGERLTRLTDWAATEDNRSRAEKEAQAHRDAVLRGLKAARRSPRRGFTEASEEFLSFCETEHDRASTVHRIKTSLASLRVWFGKRDVSAIKPADVERYKSWRLTGDESTAPVQPITVRHDLDTLSKFYRWCIRMEICTYNPVSAVSKPSSEGAVRMHVLTPEEEAEYFRRCEQYGLLNLADVARLILDQGMRPDEAMTLERRGVDLDRGRVTIFAGKTKAARRTLKLTPESLTIIRRRYASSHGSRWLFPGKRYGKPLTKLNNSHNMVIQGNVDDVPIACVLYDFRHTFATRAADKMPLTTLAAILGHSSLRMVTKYVHPTQSHMDSEMERISAAPRKTHSREPLTQ